MRKNIRNQETGSFGIDGPASSVISRRSRRRSLLALGGAALASIFVPAQSAAAAAERGVVAAQGGAPSDIKARFDFLSQHGNSSCAAEFRASIPSMPDGARLQGSCCSPMSLHRYGEQIAGLREFKSLAGQNVAEIPDDPYDVEAGTAKKLLPYYAMALTPEEQKQYDYAMQNAKDKGPCCCKCWRWEVYGGLGKYLIRTHGFTGEQVTRVWDYSDACGGEAGHTHS